MAHKQKNNKYAHLSLPQSEFDFHDRGILTEQEILDLAQGFLENEQKKGNEFVSIIVGKGIHSSNGPVIGPLLRNFIPTLTIVKECRDAPYTRGGSGALEIKLY